MSHGRRIKTVMAWSTAILMLFAAPASASELMVPATVISVYDGDTIKVDARHWLGQTIRTSVRIAGIQAKRSKKQ